MANPKNSDPNQEEVFSIEDGEWNNEVPNLTRLLDRGSTKSMLNKQNLSQKPAAMDKTDPDLEPVQLSAMEEVPLSLEESEPIATPPPAAKPLKLGPPAAKAVPPSPAASAPKSLQELGVTVEHYFKFENDQFVYSESVCHQGDLKEWQKAVLTKMEFEWKALNAKEPFQEFNQSQKAFQAIFATTKPCFIQVVRNPPGSDRLVVMQSNASLAAKEEAILSLMGHKKKAGVLEVSPQDEISIELDLAS